MEARQAVVEPAHERLSIARQGGLWGRSRSEYYCRPQAVSEADLACRRRMDEIFMQHPFFGSRRLRNELAEQGRPLGRNHVWPHDATDGTGNDLPEEASEFVQSGASRLPVSSPRPGECAAGPSLVQLHHLHPAATELCVPGDDKGLVQPPGAGVRMAGVVAARLVPQRLAGGAGAVTAGDPQPGPGKPVPDGGVHPGTARCRGWAFDHLLIVRAEDIVRGGVPPGVRAPLRRPRPPGRTFQVPQLGRPCPAPRRRGKRRAMRRQRRYGLRLALRCRRPGRRRDPP